MTLDTRLRTAGERHRNPIADVTRRISLHGEKEMPTLGGRKFKPPARRVRAPTNPRDRLKIKRNRSKLNVHLSRPSEMFATITSPKTPAKPTSISISSGL
jgi:hypothetical protein